MRHIKGNYVNKEKPVDFDVNIPGEWSELDPHQYATVVQLLQYSKADVYTMSVSLLAVLFGTKNFHILDGLQDKDPEKDLLYELVPLTNFILETKPPVINFFPVIKLRRKKHIAPATDLSNLTFGEWCFAYQFYEYYILTQDVMWLNKLIATIYRQVDPESDPDSATYRGDLREAFNENLIDKRAKSVGDLENRFKLSVYTWFSVALNEVQKLRPNVFPVVQEDPDQPALAEEPRGPDHNRTWLTVFRELLGPKWGTAEQLKHTNAMFILDALEEQQIAYKEAMKSINS